MKEETWWALAGIDPKEWVLDFLRRIYGDDHEAVLDLRATIGDGRD